MLKATEILERLLKRKSEDSEFVEEDLSPPPFIKPRFGDFVFGAENQGGVELEETKHDEMSVMISLDALENKRDVEMIENALENKKDVEMIENQCILRDRDSSKTNWVGTKVSEQELQCYLSEDYQNSLEESIESFILDQSSKLTEKEDKKLIDKPDSSIDRNLQVGVSNEESSRANSNTQMLHFFVRTSLDGHCRTLVLQAMPNDTIRSVHEQISMKTGIPVSEQRLVYHRKQLHWDHTLQDHEIQSDSTLQLVGRMRSSCDPHSWMLVCDLISTISQMRALGHHNMFLEHSLVFKMKTFLRMASGSETPLSKQTSPSVYSPVSNHMRVFQVAGAPAALVTLFLSEIEEYRECAKRAISLFFNSKYLPEEVNGYCAPVLVEFCRLLRRTTCDLGFYNECRHFLASLLESNGDWASYFRDERAYIIARELSPFVFELAGRVSTCLDEALQLTSFPMTLVEEAKDLSIFFIALCKALEEYGDMAIFVFEMHSSLEHKAEVGSFHWLHATFNELLGKIDKCLESMEKSLVTLGKECAFYRSACTSYLVALKGLNEVSKLFKGARDYLLYVLRMRKKILNDLVKHSKQCTDHVWLLLEHKDLIDFDPKRRLLLSMLPELKEDNDERYEMLIERGQLLTSSYEYIAKADRHEIQKGLLVDFKDEEAIGPGVVREWFRLVSHGIFDARNSLFLQCPNDRRRFFPNPASGVNSLHLPYFGFCGRLVAMSLMHKVQLDVVFARAFFLQLAGRSVSWEDVQDADPSMYSSCKRIMDMDPEVLDSDALGLTFVTEVEEMGLHKVIELCPGGRGITVNSSNRQQYIEQLIQHRFVTSVSEQISHFSQGFADILCEPKLYKSFFQSLELKEFDLMLYGSDRPICVKEWKAHTEYHGYKETDDQIVWFWKVVEGMSVREQKMLLCFWTSTHQLPLEGFPGLPGNLQICKSHHGPNWLPTSHTCFYQLCLPIYPSLKIMRDRILAISQEHIAQSFGFA
ncbi:hypothetical protein AMTRI_Chr10g5200 [Amborella trichopoda]|uniref:HECT-type E3 ubiquitin transferase n=1 Tax=Amborella trichopoda TaxID=13333 RepID=U5D7S8_AMBTC|nr:E3 ubiquitin-protein ligase UPL5 [Amborella trichopoda]ERN18300.1 hypothetical protein AMTR_s00055p00173600 [Amborella trichopoda]|eukprot:XP_020530726.1 E3 ubiquitin-protein ligase UPL5 [Amborella trichopoda]